MSTNIDDLKNKITKLKNDVIELRKTKFKRSRKKHKNQYSELILIDKQIELKIEAIKQCIGEIALHGENKDLANEYLTIESEEEAFMRFERQRCIRQFIIWLII